MTRLYTYKCKQCQSQFDSTIYGLEEGGHASPGCRGELVRVFSFQVNRTSLRPFQSHFNPNLGMPIQSESQLQNEMRAASDRASESTGQAHDFQMGDLRDKDLFGIKSQVDKSAHLVPTMAAHANDQSIQKAAREVLSD